MYQTCLNQQQICRCIAIYLQFIVVQVVCSVSGYLQCQKSNSADKCYAVAHLYPEHTVNQTVVEQVRQIPAEAVPDGDIDPDDGEDDNEQDDCDPELDWVVNDNLMRGSCP